MSYAKRVIQEIIRPNKSPLCAQTGATENNTRLSPKEIHDVNMKIKGSFHF